MTKKNLKLYLKYKGEDVKSVQHIERKVVSIDGLNDRYLVTFTTNNTNINNEYSIHIWVADVKNFIMVYLREKKLERLIINSL